MSIELSDVLFHFDHVLPILIQYHGALVYVLLFLLIFVQIGIPPLFFFPGNPVLFVAGAMCASHGLQLSVVIPLFFSATFLGGLLSYYWGAKLGAPYFHGKQQWVSPTALRKAHDFYEKYGVYTFVLTPFIAMIRTFAPLAAGISEMTYHKFVLSVAGGALLWSVTLTLAGFYAGDTPFFKQYLGSLLLLGLVVGLGIISASFLWRLYKKLRQ